MTRPKEKHKMYVVRKYIKATNIKQALRLEPKTDVHDCWIDEKWSDRELAGAIGFDDGIYPED